MKSEWRVNVGIGIMGYVVLPEQKDSRCDQIM